METTININMEMLERISGAALTRGVSRREIIVELLNMIMNENPQAVAMGRLVRYQKRRPRSEWRRVHVRFEADEYEYFLDLRKLLKSSLSRILATAVERYIDAILNGKATDKNRHTNYLIIKEEIDSITCWRLIWGYPPSISRHLWPKKKA